MECDKKLEKGYYGIRLESIGGLGANLCGKMLGELGVWHFDVNSSSFASYGSEKTGTPVKSYIRFCKKEKEIRAHSPVENPDLLVVFHKSLLMNKNTIKCFDENTKVLIAIDDKNDDFCVEGLTSECYGINATQIAIETKSRINMVLLGAILKLLGLNDTEAGEKICEKNLGKKYPEALKGNIEGIRRGFLEVRRMEGDCKKIIKPMDYEQRDWGYDNAPIGGINPRIGNSVIADLSPSRMGYVPIFIKEKCINCGLCYSTCPDMVFQFKKGTYNGREMMVNCGLDYYHCKGCLRCVHVCPVNALEKGEELKKEKIYFITNQELLRNPDYYEKTGPDGYITSESFFTEKRMDGGEV